MTSIMAQPVSLRACLERFFASGTPPSAEERASFRYPEIKLSWRAAEAPPALSRSYAKLESPGTYSTTITQPEFFRDYLHDQLKPLASDYGATISVDVSADEIPYPYVLDRGDEFGRGTVTAADLARYFPIPKLSAVGDEIADGTWAHGSGETRPLALFDAVRVDYSLKRLVHYTGLALAPDPALDPAHQLPPLRRSVRRMGRHAVQRSDSPYNALQSARRRTPSPVA